MTDPAIIAGVEELATELQEARIANYAHVTGFIIVYFDWLLVFDSEIKLIWNAKGVKMKILYLLTRYLPVIYFPLLLWYYFGNGFTDSECTALYEAASLMFMIGAICAALVATIRTWAVWAKEKYMTYVLFGTYTVASALVLALYIISLKHSGRLLSYFFAEQVFSGTPFLLSCNLKYDNYLPAAFVVEAAYDTVVLLLMLIRGVSLFHWGKDSDLFRTIYGDGVLFYVYITVISIANFSLLFSGGPLASLLLMLQGAVRSVLACRIVLRIRMRHGKQQTKWQQNTENGYATVHIERMVIESSDA